MTASIEKRARFAGVRRGVLWWLAALLIFTLLVAAGQWRSGAWSARYGAYPDESAHFVGGLMVHDYLLSGTRSPLTFARNYYLFQPYFAIGFWPPLFYVLEGFWMLLAGYSRISVMILSGGLSVLVALLMFAAVRQWVSGELALAIAASFLVIPSVEWSSSLVMTDICVVFFCLATTLAAGRYFETRAWVWAILTGVAASLALLTKYLALYVLLPPALLILIDRRWDLIRSARTWSIAGVIAILCGPWVFWSRKFALIGWDFQRVDLWRRVWDIVAVLRADLGNILIVTAVLAVLWALGHWKPLTDTQRLLCLQLPCVAGFVYAGPSGIEGRHFMPGYPGLLAVIALAIQSTGSKRGHWRQPWPWRHLMVLVLAAVVVVRAATDKIEKLPGGVVRQVARDVSIAQQSGAILVPASMEGPTIAELVSAEPERSRILLIRPSKLLARMNWTGTQYQLVIPDVEALTLLFDKYPINTIIMATFPGRAEFPHDRLLRQMLAADKRWGVRRKYTEPGGGYWEVYRRPSSPDAGNEALLAFMRTHLPAMQ